MGFGGDVAEGHVDWVALGGRDGNAGALGLEGCVGGEDVEVVDAHV